MNKFSKNNKRLLTMLIIVLMIIAGCSPTIDSPANSGSEVFAGEVKSDTINKNKDNSAIQESTKSDNENLIVTKTESNNDSSLPAINGELEVHFIDVGQGDSVLIKQGEHSMLIDAGDNHKGQDVVNYLKNENVKTLDYVIGTHPHADHIGGLDDVINTFNVKAVILPDKIHTTKTFEDVLKAIVSNNLKAIKAVAGDSYDLGKAKFTILAPITNTDSNLNNHSVAIKLEFGDNSFMFSGDAEDAAEQQIINSGVNVQADVLKAGHHGSNTSNTDSFVSKVNPDYVIIQVGEDNKYNHPNVDIVDRFTNMGAEVYRNDLHGSVIVKSDGKNIEVNTNKGDIPKSIGGGSNNTAIVPPIKVNNDKPKIEKPIIETPKNENPISASFVGTKTTKVFHKNNCRHVPKEENRAYFETTEQALNNGYRVCRVCKP